MIDKVQKIREEVARIQLYTQSEVLKQVLDYIDEVQKEPVSMWHDVSEEPCEDRQVLVCLSGNYYVDFYHKKDKRFYMCFNPHHYLCKVDRWAYIDDIIKRSNVQGTTKNCKEPVSEDLEEAIEQSFIYHENRGDDFRSDEQIETTYRYGFETGAKWQQERDEADRAAVYKCGWNDRKAMMMKKSFDAKILPTNIEETEFCLDDYEEVAIITEMVNKGEFKMGDKVKVIVIKEG